MYKNWWGWGEYAQIFRKHLSLANVCHIVVYTISWLLWKLQRKIAKERYNSFSYFLIIKCFMIWNVQFLITGFFQCMKLDLSGYLQSSITGKTGLYNFVLLWNESNYMIIKEHRACFLNSSQFTLTFWSVALCIINSPKVPLSTNISI